eukprot:TRINITY_DN4207_c0_g1_i2.p2 TRINITY_DN4207_c0_g1~~TRINITY_DN4207_c0_g1_i2.p2  ORF type:complete len:231 (+),score=52.18 TRINITY_DN4207_c0_g1_i2:1151-1843(+)
MRHLLSMCVPMDGVVYYDQIAPLCRRAASPPTYTPAQLAMSFVLAGDSTLRTTTVACPPAAQQRSLPLLPPPPPLPGAAVTATAVGDVPCLILVPLRLGVERLNEEYLPELKKLLSLPQSVGLIGGRQKESLYFVGFQDDNLIYLDPHIVHKADFVQHPETYHCQFPQSVDMREIEPSLAVGFYCSNVADARNLVDALTVIQNHTSFPVVSAAEHQPDYLVESLSSSAYF